MAPISIPDKTLQAWRTVNRFIWSGKNSRVKFKILQDSIEEDFLFQILDYITMKYNIVCILLITDNNG